jgi:predicted 3-demethylubiquinone-9 3-methyltransferase (glyoxalase superfamily)
MVNDRFGVSWQVVPVQMYEAMRSGDPVRMNRLLAAMVTMKKLDLATLMQA